MNRKTWVCGLTPALLLPSLCLGEEKPSPVLTALSSTSISGYVSASAWWAPGTGNANPPAFSYAAGKADGFNLDVMKLSIDRPLDEYPFSAGYRVDLVFGPDANALATTSTGDRDSDFAIKQAYVVVAPPLVDGIDLRVGVWDTIIGYETFDAPNNADYTRSYGYTIEPTTHTGLLGTWRVNEVLGIAVGVANTFGPVIDEKAHPPSGPKAESYKTYMGSVSLTAPESFGSMKGSTLYLGVINGYNGGTGVDQTSYYAGGTLVTPLTGLKVGASVDYVQVREQALTDSSFYAGAYALYISFQATGKLAFHTRAEYANNDVPGILTPLVLDDTGAAFDLTGSKVFALTGTVQYDLWKNVLSRLEVRWDHAADGSRPYGGSDSADPTIPGSGGDRRNHFIVAANLVYRF